MSTLTKKIKILNKYVSEGKSEQTVLIIYDIYGNLDSEEIDYSELPERERYSISDLIAQFEAKEGELYEMFSVTAAFNELCKTLDSGKCYSINRTYEDSLKKFEEKYPDWKLHNKQKADKKFNELMSLYGAIRGGMFSDSVREVYDINNRRW